MIDCDRLWSAMDERARSATVYDHASHEWFGMMHAALTLKLVRRFDIGPPRPRDEHS